MMLRFSAAAVLAAVAVLALFQGATAFHRRIYNNHEDHHATTPVGEPLLVSQVRETKGVAAAQ